MGERVAFIGLGVMGYAMAGHLAKAGLDVTVYNRTAEKSDRWVAEFGGRQAATPAEAADGSRFVLACVGNDDDVRAVTIGAQGAFAGMDDGSIFIDHTTASARLARDLESVAAARGIGFLDAPVSGGQAGAENGALTIMVGGTQKAYDLALPIMSKFARSVRLMGASGSGQLTKMVNQICIAGVVEGLSEGLHFAQKVGLDPRAVIDVISKGAAQSWQMENRFETMIKGEFEHGFAVDWMRKDLDICLAHAKECAAHLPVTALVDQFYSEVQSMGGGRWDTSSLIARLDGRPGGKV